MTKTTTFKKEIATPPCGRLAMTEGEIATPAFGGLAMTKREWANTRLPRLPYGRLAMTNSLSLGLFLAYA
jgi:hypothetical protein